jgi:hypothetical protein
MSKAKQKRKLIVGEKDKQRGVMAREFEFVSLGLEFWKATYVGSQEDKSRSSTLYTGYTELDHALTVRCTISGSPR